MPDEVTVQLWQSDRRLYLNKKGKAVEADDDTRVELLVEAGGVLPLEDARKYGLVDKDGVTVQPTGAASAAKEK